MKIEFKKKPRERQLYLRAWPLRAHCCLAVARGLFGPNFRFSFGFMWPERFIRWERIRRKNRGR